MKKVLIIILIGVSSSLFGQEDQLEPDTSFFDSIYRALTERYSIIAYYDSIEKTFEYQKGRVYIGDDSLAYLDVPSGFKYLGSKNSALVLSEIWGNEPSSTLGLLFPDSTSAMSANFTYAIDITYSEEGFVDDKDAKNIDSDELLALMQLDSEYANAIRQKNGFPSMALLDWAVQPQYNQETNKLHWAKKYQVDEDSSYTLNYDIRVLGRNGYLNLKAIGNIDILPLVQRNLQDILNSVQFIEGHRYEDYDSGTDKNATYGIRGLIVGKALNNVSWFAKAVRWAIEHWNLLFIVFIILIAIFKKNFGRKK